MLRSATGGGHFKSTTHRDIPVLSDWTKEQALKIESKIRKAYSNFSGDGISLHSDNMEELDEIEYPTIVGHSWEEAQDVLMNLEMIMHNLDAKNEMNGNRKQ